MNFANYDNTLESSESYMDRRLGCRLPHDTEVEDADKLLSLSGPVITKSIALVEAEDTFKTAIQAFENLHMAFMHNNSQKFQPMLIDNLVKARLRVNNAYSVLLALGGDITCLNTNKPYVPYNTPTKTWNRRKTDRGIEPY